MNPFSVHQPDPPEHKLERIHPTAIIHPTAVLDVSVEVGPYSVIGEDVHIRAQTKIGSHCVIEFAEIGGSCQIYPHSFIGTAPQDLKYRGEKTKIIIGDGTIIRECATLNRGTARTGQTIIGKGCLFMAYSHVAHDCVIEDEVILANSVAVAGHVTIGRGTIVGGLSGIHQFVKIGRLVMVGAGAMVPMDVPPFCVVWGDRARIVGLNMEGLRRRHYSQALIRSLRDVYKKVFFSAKNLKQTLQKMQKEANHAEEVLEFLRFVQNSTRGICRPRQKVETSASQTW